jgi:HTH-type transcriptional regulator/antitoxin HigA
MDLKLILTEQDYRAALAEVDRLWEAPDNSPASDRLDELVTLIEQYEREHFPIADPDPA